MAPDEEVAIPDQGYDRLALPRETMECLDYFILRQNVPKGYFILRQNVQKEFSPKSIAEVGA